MYRYLAVKNRYIDWLIDWLIYKNVDFLQLIPATMLSSGEQLKCVQIIWRQLSVLLYPMRLAPNATQGEM